jgi:hypothetical protein
MGRTSCEWIIFLQIYFSEILFSTLDIVQRRTEPHPSSFGEYSSVTLQISSHYQNFVLQMNFVTYAGALYRLLRSLLMV